MVYRLTKEVQDKKDAKRQLILDTAADVFAARGYHATTIKDIADTAGIAVGSIYKYFKNKEDLFAALYDEIAEVISGISRRVVLPGVYNTARNFCRAMTANLWAFQTYRSLARIMLVEAIGLNPQFEAKRIENVRKGVGFVETLLASLKDKGLVRIIDPHIAALIFESSSYYIILDWLYGDQTTELTADAPALCSYNLQALGIDFEPNAVPDYIEEVLTELTSDSKER